MSKIVVLLFALFAVSHAQWATAAPSDIEELIEQQRQHGYVSPAAAAQALEQYESDLAGQPVALRLAYHAQLALLYINAEDGAKVALELAELDRMARDEKCVPCGQYKLLRTAQQAVRGQNAALAQSLLSQVEALSSDDKNLMQIAHYVRAGIYDGVGNHSRAIEEGLVASQLAIATGNQAEQARALNMLMLSNLGRRDLVRAESLANEAFALSERMGFIYMMAYVRSNSAWIYSLKGEPQKVLAALNDALAITRAHPGLRDPELVALVNLAEYYSDQKDFKKAVDMATQAIALADKQNKIVAKGVAMSSLGQAQIELGNIERGVQSMEQSLALLTKAGSRSYLLTTTTALSKAYERAGRYKEALLTLQDAVKLQEDAKKIDREKALAEAQEKFSGERKDNEILRLSLENRGRQAEVAARVWQQRLWATAALALALGGALLILMIKRSRARNRMLEDSNAVLSDQSVHDPLTGAFNRRHCVTLMSQQEAQLAGKSRDRNYSTGVGLMLLDVDHFKHVNDGYGHAAGDAVLVEIAQRLLGLVRQHDVVVRWGGEEFVLVLPGTSAEGLTVLAERVLKVVGEQPVMVDGTAVPVTVSAGCVCYPLLEGQPWQDALKVADLAMYMAKEGGRNRAVCVLGVTPDVDRELLVHDVGQAVQLGQVTARTIFGPGADPAMLVAI